MRCCKNYVEIKNRILFAEVKELVHKDKKGKGELTEQKANHMYMYDVVHKVLVYFTYIYIYIYIYITLNVSLLNRPLITYFLSEFSLARGGRVLKGVAKVFRVFCNGNCRDVSLILTARGDADLYGKEGSPPRISSSDCSDCSLCKSRNGDDSSDTCIVTTRSKKTKLSNIFISTLHQNSIANVYFISSDRNN